MVSFELLKAVTNQGRVRCSRTKYSAGTTKEYLSGTPCVAEIREEHLSTLAFAVLYLVFLVKLAFDLTGKAAV